MVTWHADSAFFIIANEKSQLQCLDISLSYISNQILNDNVLPVNVLELTNFFLNKPSLTQIKCSIKSDSIQNKIYLHTDSNVLLLFEDGPMAVLKLFGVNMYKIDIFSSGLTAEMLIQQYLKTDNVEKAINILLCLNWDRDGSIVMMSLQKISNYIFKQPFQPRRVTQLQRAFSSYLGPLKDLFHGTRLEFGDQVKDITRKFFQYLVRNKSFEEAFTLASDIEDDDLFMDLNNCAKENGYFELANDAYKKARETLDFQDEKSRSRNIDDINFVVELNDETKQ